MLRSLHIRNYILIDSLDVEFPEGLSIISGQTGAGKSILLGALSLLTGAKADASLISSGAQNCIAEAEFEVSDPEIHQMVEDAGAEWDESGFLTIRRVVHMSGRSRSFINDCPVQLGVLSEMASRLVDIHSQHQSLMLGDPSFQLSVLDAYARNSELLGKCAALWDRLLELRRSLSALEAKIAQLASERDYNEARFRRLDEARLREGELEELEKEHRKLANATAIQEALAAAHETLSPSSDDMRGVCASLKDASRALSRIEAFMQEAAALSERLAQARVEIDDADSELCGLLDGVDASPARLQALEERMSLLYDLMNAFDCRDVAGLIAERDSLSSALYDSDALVEERDALQGRIASAGKEYTELCSQLRARRAAAAPELAAKIQGDLRFLELDNALFRIALEDAPEGLRGADATRFLLSSAGQEPVDVRRCASGGEISRIMLCLKAVMASFTGMPTMIFDEIDSGVSGSAADKMGSMICRMGADMQVLAITHLPQGAAKGQAHFLVSKSAGDGTVVSTVRQLSADERVMEIARMLSGTSISPEAIANARRLLSD